jgi:hypothetical protein
VAKLGAFDLVVTIALGSTLSATLLQESVALAEGAVLALLILLQLFVAFYPSVPAGLQSSCAPNLRCSQETAVFAVPQ